MRKVVLISFILIYFIFNTVKCYLVELTNNGPVVTKATINFKAELFDNYRQKVSPDNYFTFKWNDNAMPPHTGKSEGYATESFWNTSYSTPGRYEVQVVVYVSAIIFDRPITSARQLINITLMLNGDMELEQNNSTIDFSKQYVSTGSEVKHHVALTEPDAWYLNSSATAVLTYWFVDCVYYGVTDDYQFAMNYTNQMGQVKHVEALVIASFVQPTEAPPTVAPTTPTPVPNSTSTVTATPTLPANVTEPTKAAGSNMADANKKSTTTPTAPTVLVGGQRNRRNAVPDSNAVHLPSNSAANVTNATIVRPVFTPVLLQNVTLVQGKNYSRDPDFPYVCVNSSVIPATGDESYGYFRRRFSVKDPVENVSFTGTNWLKQGDMLNLGVSCNGSAPFFQCVQVLQGEHNITGNETCDNVRILTDCRFSIIHYFRSAETYTLIIIISNEVSKMITPVAVNIYEVTKHPQLSVIVVPVACSAVAVILIVFGIAYYIQSRTRYTVEVADFDFAQTTDMEYKTFSERLRDAMSNAINRTQDYVEEGNVWSPSRKYGSMQ